MTTPNSIVGDLYPTRDRKSAYIPLTYKSLRADDDDKSQKFTSVHHAVPRPWHEESPSTPRDMACGSMPSLLLALVQSVDLLWCRVLTYTMYMPLYPGACACACATFPRSRMRRPGRSKRDGVACPAAPRICNVNVCERSLPGTRNTIDFVAFGRWLCCAGV